MKTDEEIGLLIAKQQTEIQELKKELHFFKKLSSSLHAKAPAPVCIELITATGEVMFDINKITIIGEDNQQEPQPVSPEPQDIIVFSENEDGQAASPTNRYNLRPRPQNKSSSKRTKPTTSSSAHAPQITTPKSLINAIKYLEKQDELFDSEHRENVEKIFYTVGQMVKSVFPGRIEKIINQGSLEKDTHIPVIGKVDLDLIIYVNPEPCTKWEEHKAVLQKKRQKLAEKHPALKKVLSNPELEAEEPKDCLVCFEETMVHQWRYHCFQELKKRYGLGSSSHNKKNKKQRTSYENSRCTGAYLDVGEEVTDIQIENLGSLKDVTFDLTGPSNFLRMKVGETCIDLVFVPNIKSLHNPDNFYWVDDSDPFGVFFNIVGNLRNEFVKRQSKQVKTLIRLAKLWKSQQADNWTAYCTPPSFFVELLIIHCFREYQKKALNAESSSATTTTTQTSESSSTSSSSIQAEEEMSSKAIQQIFAHFLSLLANYESLDVVLSDSYFDIEVAMEMKWKGRKPLVLDPALQNYNYAKYFRIKDYRTLKTVASKALAAFTSQNEDLALQHS